MRTIGLTGGIASGKSLVSQWLVERGAAVVDADKVGHEAYRRGSATFDAVVEAFGDDIVGADGEIDRKALGPKVFGDEKARKRLEGIVWPAMRRMMEERIAELRAQGTEVTVLEAALLIEADWLPLVDEVWLVTASPDTVRERLMARNSLTPEQAESRIKAQLSNDERRPYANVVIENDGTAEELRRVVNETWSRLQAQVS
ncbi:MAG: dephospho-CoA kinase [Dehalococcoidia bacterium]